MVAVAIADSAEIETVKPLDRRSRQTITPSLAAVSRYSGGMASPVLQGCNDRFRSAAVVSLEESKTILNQQAETLAQQFNAVYSNYLAALAATVKEQLIQACYQLCTQIYPEQFLAMDTAKQQALQLQLRELGQTTVANLTVMHLLETAKKRAIAEAEIAVQLAQAAAENADDDQTSSDENESGKSELKADLEAASAETSQLEEAHESTESKEQSAAAIDPEAATLDLDLSYLQLVPPAHPAAIYAWQRSLNRSLVRQLRQTSRQANRLLEKAGILRSTMPPQVIEAAMKNDGAEQPAGPPNVLRLSIDTSTEGEEDETDSTVHLAAIYLRLADLEFSVPELRIARQQLRDCQRQLKQLGRLVAAEERRQAIAQAETAWRFAWNQEC